jgi:conjugal transfer pilus assembly protein TraV
MTRLLIVLTALFVLSGCGSMSGYDAHSGFACKAPDGVLCESMTGVYANAEQNNLPGQRVRHGSSDANKTADATQNDSVVLTKPLTSGTPIRSAPRVLRVWFAPWEDTDGDLHDQSVVYLPVDSGHWLVEHNRRRIQDAYRPVYAPAKTPTAPTVSSTTGSDLPSAELGSNMRSVPDQGVTSISAIQSRMSPAETSGLMDGIQTPAQLQQQ